MTLSGYVPVDGPNIVTILVGADVIKLKACTLKDRVIIALHPCVNRLPDLDFVLVELLKYLFHAVNLWRLAME